MAAVHPIESNAPWKKVSLVKKKRFRDAGSHAEDAQRHL